MVEGFGWGSGGEPKIDLDGVALVGADPFAVFGKDEAALVVVFHDVVELLFSERAAVSCELGEELVDIDPALGIESDTDG